MEMSSSSWHVIEICTAYSWQVSICHTPPPPDSVGLNTGSMWFSNWSKKNVDDRKWIKMRPCWLHYSRTSTYARQPVCVWVQTAMHPAVCSGRAMCLCCVALPLASSDLRPLSAHMNLIHSQHTWMGIAAWSTAICQWQRPRRCPQALNPYKLAFEIIRGLVQSTTTM